MRAVKGPGPRCVFLLRVRLDARDRSYPAIVLFVLISWEANPTSWDVAELGTDCSLPRDESQALQYHIHIRSGSLRPDWNLAMDYWDEGRAMKAYISNLV